ncbi:DUF5343 domain-containing protein [Phreatobacter oligotrophus]|uniref:DUF5343 domain-containing protein n=1 Tax=Phreatobacter oligotrophus TaxID=1122261 RepID=UPI001474A44F|nr:DUF5343 domain-containing protein [Phreatobacter oligotrophus]
MPAPTIPGIGMVSGILHLIESEHTRSMQPLRARYIVHGSEIAEEEQSERWRGGMTGSPKDAQKAVPPPTDAAKKAVKVPKADIPDGLCYVNAPNQLKSVLDKIIEASRPDKLTIDYVGDVWGFKSSSFRAVLAVLKRVGFTETDGRPTDTYSKFRTENNRSEAALAALRNGFPDIFKRREFAQHLSEKDIADIVVDITGRERSDPTLRAIVGTFRTFAGYVAKSDESRTTAKNSDDRAEKTDLGGVLAPPNDRGNSSIGLSYQINIILPETTNIEVFNSIFCSIRENLLR